MVLCLPLRWLEEETNLALIKVVEITSVETSVVAKGGESLELAGERVTV